MIEEKNVKDRLKMICCVNKIARWKKSIDDWWNDNQYNMF